MSDGLRLTSRQIYLLRGAMVNMLDYDNEIDPPYFHPDRRDCKILQSHLLFRHNGRGWLITGLGKDLVRKLNDLESKWMEILAEGHEPITPYR